MTTYKKHEFNQFTARYHSGNAYNLAEVSRLVYKTESKSTFPDESKILSDLQKLDARYQEVSGFEKNSSQGVVIKHDEYVVAVFRGTDEFADWLDNINARAIDGPLGKVHKGFYNALLDVWPAMKTVIREFKKNEGENEPNKPLWITGHSLGGAMATLAAATLSEADEPYYGVYTFGSPRVGDRDFEVRFNSLAKSKFFRFQNNADIVTRIPARLMGYSHVGTFIYISEDGELSRDNGYWYRFLDTLKGIISNIGDMKIDQIKDHDIKAYIKGIKRHKGLELQF